MNEGNTAGKRGPEFHAYVNIVRPRDGSRFYALDQSRSINEAGFRMTRDGKRDSRLLTATMLISDRRRDPARYAIRAVSYLPKG